MPEGIIDVEARRQSAEVRHELHNYMAVNDIKMTNVATDVNSKHGDLKSSLAKIESLLKWAGSLIITLILGVLGWSLVQQVQSNEQQKRDLQSQIKLLEQAEKTRLLQQPEMRVLPPSAAEAALAAERRR